MHLHQRAFKILDQLCEGPLYRAAACDQHIIIAFDRKFRGGEPDGLLEPPPCTVADHRTTEALRRCKAKPDKCGRRPSSRLTLAGLKHDRRC